MTHCCKVIRCTLPLVAVNKKGWRRRARGIILLKAENLEETQKIAQNDPLVERGIYRYELLVWDLAVLSEDIVD